MKMHLTKFSKVATRQEIWRASVSTPEGDFEDNWVVGTDRRRFFRVLTDQQFLAEATRFARRMGLRVEEPL